MPNPPTEFLSETDYFEQDKIKEREDCLIEFLFEGPYDYGMLLTLLGVWNDQFCDGTCKHALWIAKPQTAVGAVPVVPVLKQELSRRIAFRLARWKWLNYNEAHDETVLGFLNLSLAAAGYLPPISRVTSEHLDWACKCTFLTAA